MRISITPPWLSPQGERPTQGGQQQPGPVLEHHLRDGVASSYVSAFSTVSPFLQQTPASPEHGSLPILILFALTASPRLHCLDLCLAKILHGSVGGAALTLSLQPLAL